jgi:hypothetical protein
MVFLEASGFFDGVSIVGADLVAHPVKDQPAGARIHLDIRFVNDPLETGNDLEHVQPR